MLINLNKALTQLKRAMCDNQTRMHKSLTEIVFNKNQTNK